MPECIYRHICGLEAIHEGFCILHSKNPKKDLKDFGRAFEDHRTKIGYKFNLFVFPFNFILELREFPSPVDFTGTKFYGRADFSGSYFGNSCTFKGTLFNEKADFIGCTFIGEVDFSHTNFMEGMAFISSKFNGSASFGYSKINKSASFMETVFSKDVYFYMVQFLSPVYFLHSRFLGFTLFEGANFSGKASFHGATFEKEVSLFNTTFYSEADFKNAEFSGGADFRQTKFEKGPVIFTGSFLKERVTFSASSEGVRVQPNSSEQEIISGSEDQLIPLFSDVEVCFDDVTIHPLNAVAFRRVDLRKARFLGTDMREIELTDVNFHVEGGRTVVYDELTRSGMLNTPNFPFILIERLYRDLKQNYEDRRDFERAGEFHYGEKEMRRLNPQTTAGSRFILTAYKFLSGYGERYWPPLVWSTILLLISAIGYLCTGNGLVLGKDETKILNFSEIKDWLPALHYSLQSMTLLRPDNLVLTETGRIFHTIESILGPFLLGLFGLALRQRLRR